MAQDTNVAMTTNLKNIYCQVKAWRKVSFSMCSKD